jgi:hypothetical protein
MQLKGNNMKVTIYFILIISLFSSCRKEGNTKINCDSYPIPEDTYQLPVEPFSPQWFMLSVDERFSSTQIPDSILTLISTEGLIQSWMTFPFNFEIRLGNSIQTSVEFFIENYSGLRELVTRTDALDKLLSRYQHMNPHCVNSFLSDVERGSFVFSFNYLEFILGQKILLNKTGLIKKKELVGECLKKYDIEAGYPEAFGKLGLEACLFVCARVMVHSGYQPFEKLINTNIEFFIQHGRFPIPTQIYTEEMKIIRNSARKFIK